MPTDKVEKGAPELEVFASPEPIIAVPNGQGAVDSYNLEVKSVEDNIAVLQDRLQTAQTRLAFLIANPVTLHQIQE